MVKWSYIKFVLKLKWILKWIVLFEKVETVTLLYCVLMSLFYNILLAALFRPNEIWNYEPELFYR